MKKIILFIFLILLPSISFAETIIVGVEGMTCDSCAQSIQKEVASLPEVKEAKVSFEEKKLEMVLAEDKELSEQEIKGILSRLGYQITNIVRK